ncbi:MAG: 50S ribosomal protein L2 [Chitinophagaceae bacterium]|nr:50S ribosomal protein L2 [Chitinophagaceae bacterium]
MPLKKIKPVTPGQRFRIAPDYSILTAQKPEKSLLIRIKKTGGRNNKGRRTMRYIGGGHKQMYRIIDFKRNKFNIEAIVKSIEYDPYRSSFVALVYYKDGEKTYIIAPHGIQVGQTIMSGSGIPPEIGNALPISEIPLGTIIHNIEIKPGQGGNMVRSAGCYAQLIAREGKYATIKMPSNEVRTVLVTCTATIGSVSNAEHMNISIGKAGRSRWMGRRPRVRGVAMNPVDHPMGGGEGKASGGQPRSRKGLYSKGKKTRSKIKYSNNMIITKRK